MTKKRRRQIKLIGDVLLNLMAISFGAVGLIVLIHNATTPGLSDKPFDSTLEPIIGHTATLIFFAAFCLFIIVSAVVFLRRAIRLLRNREYLEYEPPPFEDYR